MIEEPGPVGPAGQLAVFRVGETGGEEVTGLSGFVDGNDAAVTCLDLVY